MNPEILKQLETRCRNIHSELSSLLFWEWDDRFNIPLSAFSKEHAEKVHSIISKEFDAIWDSKTIKKASKPVRKIAKALGGIQENQILFTSNPDSEIILFATWWPWGNNEKISVRIGVSCEGKMAVSEIELTLNIKKWFDLQ
jgi:hypothetical protein